MHPSACLCKVSCVSDCLNLSTSFKVAASSLSSDDIVTLLTCKAPSGTSVSTETWKLFFQKVAGVLEDALSKFSNKVGDTPAFSGTENGVLPQSAELTCPIIFTDPNKRSASVPCSRCHWRGEGQQLQRRTADGCQLRCRLVPGQAETIFVSSLSGLSVLP